MKSMTVGEFKAQFSDVLDQVKSGESVVVEYGKSRAKVAVLVPFEEYISSGKRKLGILEGKATYKVGPDFSMTDEELLSS